MRSLLLSLVLAALSFNSAWSESVFEWDEESEIENGLVWMELPSETAKDATAGLAWRVKDAENYYLAVYVGEDDVVGVFSVLEGKEELLRAEVTKLKPGKNRLEIRYVDDLVTVYLNDDQVMVVKDDSITGAGGVGWMAENVSTKEAPPLQVAEWEPETKQIKAVTKEIEWTEVETYDDSYLEEVTVETVTEMTETWETEEETIISEESEEIEVFESVEEYETYERYEEVVYEETVEVEEEYVEESEATIEVSEEEIEASEEVIEESEEIVEESEEVYEETEEVEEEVEE